MASNTWRSLEALVNWSDSVEYRALRGAPPLLVITFNDSAAFFRWRDWCEQSGLVHTYVRRFDDVVVVTVVVEQFFRSVTNPSKWRVNNRKG